MCSLHAYYTVIASTVKVTVGVCVRHPITPSFLHTLDLSNTSSIHLLTGPFTPTRLSLAITNGECVCWSSCAPVVADKFTCLQTTLKQLHTPHQVARVNACGSSNVMVPKTVY